MRDFGQRPWNAAFDAGYAAALGKSLIIMHGADHQHALKEVDGIGTILEIKDRIILTLSSNA